MACDLSAHIIYGDAKCLQYRNSLSQSCRTCDPDFVFVPVLQLDAAQLKPQPKGQCETSHRFPYSVAADVAVKFFDSINSQLDKKTAWVTINNLLRQATGQRFTVETLRKYFDLECIKRGLPVRKPVHGGSKPRGKTCD